MDAILLYFLEEENGRKIWKAEARTVTGNIVELVLEKDDEPTMEEWISLLERKNQEILAAGANIFPLKSIAVVE